MLRSPHIRRREDFGQLLSRRGLASPASQAVEIGTHLGRFAESFLTHWPAGRLTCIDPWQTKMPDYSGPPSHGNRDKHFQQCRDRLAKFGDRVSYLRMTSEEAAGHFPDASLDFVYIDGNHAPDYVRQDISLWWPKVKPGGILAGHDNGPPHHPPAAGVKAEVERFLASEQFEQFEQLQGYWLPGPAWSWYVEKPVASA